MINFVMQPALLFGGEIALILMKWLYILHAKPNGFHENWKQKKKAKQHKDWNSLFESNTYDWKISLNLVIVVASTVCLLFTLVSVVL